MPKAYREREPEKISERERFRLLKDLEETRASAIDKWDKLRRDEMEREDKRKEEESRSDRRGRGMFRRREL